VAMAFPLAVRSEPGRERLLRLIDALSDRDFKVRLQATLALGQLKDRRSVPALIRALQDDRALVRGMAALALGAIGDTRAVAPLQLRLKDTDARVRQRAKTALSQVTQSSRAARKPVWLRLGGMGDKTRSGGDLVPQLRRLWSDRIEQSPGLRLASQPQAAASQEVYEVSSAITELFTKAQGGLWETTCSVSLILGDRRGSILMMTSGGATVHVQSRQVRKDQQSALRVNALERAIASAHTNLLEYLARR